MIFFLRLLAPMRSLGPKFADIGRAAEEITQLGFHYTVVPGSPTSGGILVQPVNDKTIKKIETETKRAKVITPKIVIEETVGNAPGRM